MDEVFASVTGTAIVIFLVLSGSVGEALTLGQALGTWLNAVLPV
jgi:hypothetical protein